MEIPDKIFFKIGEVSELAGVKPYVLRYWETEFSIVPHKSGSGQRLYRRKDIERILLIKRLLYAEGFTIAGARKYLSRVGRSGGEPFADPDASGESDERGQHPEDVLEQALGSEQVEEPAADQMPESGLDTAGEGPDEMIIDPDWLEAMREELRGLQALIQAAREFKV